MAFPYTDSLNQTAELFQKDPELNGALSHAVGHGANFSLILSMLQGNVLSRPRFEQENLSVVAEKKQQQTLELLSCYPKAPLALEAHHVDEQNCASRLLHQDIHNAKLWQIMHPAPLSEFNNPRHLNDEVLMNCDYHTQLRHQHVRGNESLSDQALISEDATGLYEVLNALQQEMAA